MEYALANGLDYPVHVTVVEHSEMAVAIVLSLGQVPVPTGKVLQREMIEPGEVWVMKDLANKLRITLDRRKLPDTIAKQQMGKTKKEIPIVLVSLSPKTGGPEEVK